MCDVAVAVAVAALAIVAVAVAVAASDDDGDDGDYDYDGLECDHGAYDDGAAAVAAVDAVVAAPIAVAVDFVRLP